MTDTTLDDSPSSTIDKRPAFWPIWQFAGLAFAIAFFLMSFNHMLQFLGAQESEGMTALAGFLILLSLGLAGYSMWAARALASHYRKATRIAWLSELSRTIFFVGLLQMMSMITIPAFTAARLAANKAEAQQTIDQPWTTHTSADRSHSVQAPADWELYPNSEIGALGIQLTQPQLGLHFLTSVFSKQDFNVKSLDEVIQLSMQSHRQMTPGMDVKPTKIAQIGGRRCRQTMLSKTFERTNLTCCMLHWEESDVWCEVQYWTLASRFDENLPLFEQMVGTIQLTH